MRVFDHPTIINNWKCPICKTADDKEVVLVGIDGTQEDNCIEAQQYHLDCIDLTEYKRDKHIIIAMNVKE